MDPNRLRQWNRRAWGAFELTECGLSATAMTVRRQAARQNKRQLLLPARVASKHTVCSIQDTWSRRLTVSPFAIRTSASWSPARAKGYRRAPPDPEAAVQ